MTTVTASEARLKVRFDLSGEQARLSEMEAALKRLQGAGGVGGPGAAGGRSSSLSVGPAERRAKSTASEKDSDESWKDNYFGKKPTAEGVLTKAKGFAFDPLNAVLDVVSAIPGGGPVVAGSVRTAMNVGEAGLPFVRGFGKAAMKAAGYGEDSLVQSSMDKVFKTMAGMTEAIAEIRAKNDSIAPAFEAMKKMAMAQIMMGGVPNGQDLSTFAKTMFDIMYAHTSLSRKVERLSLEAVGDASEQLFGDLFR
jgi:hypothetical protein